MLLKAEAVLWPQILKERKMSHCLAQLEESCTNTEKVKVCLAQWFKLIPSFSMLLWTLSKLYTLFSTNQVNHVSVICHVCCMLSTEKQPHTSALHCRSPSEILLGHLTVLYTWHCHPLWIKELTKMAYVRWYQPYNWKGALSRCESGGEVTAA